MHAVEGSGQQKEDSGNEIKVVNEPQLQCTDIYLSMHFFTTLNPGFREATLPQHSGTPIPAMTLPVMNMCYS